MSKPARIFIGSASESLNIASDVEELLITQDHIVTRWDKAFSPSVVILTELARIAADSDFGIFVFSADDLTVSRHKKSHSVRDNVILEAGIFIGSLGPHRTFLLAPGTGRSKLLVPSDFGGVVMATYRKNAPRRGKNGLVFAVEQIAQRMDALGRAQRNPHNEMIALRAKLQETLVECTDGLMTVLDVIEPAACAHTRPWSILSRPEMLIYPLQEGFDDELVNEVYWWLVVEGVFKFKDIEQFGTEDWNWDDSIEFVEMSSRGAAFLNLLRAEGAQRG